MNDHVRDRLDKLTWLLAIEPRLKEKTFDYQLQVNLLLALLTIHKGDYLWPDFARFYGNYVAPLVSKIRYDKDFQSEIIKLFGIDSKQIGPLFKQYLEKLSQSGMGKYHWRSIGRDAFLTQQEK